jgi:hypothetical protein
MEKFYNYLQDQNKPFFKKEELEEYYQKFKKIWKLNIPFSNVLNSLRKNKLTYLIDGYWALSKDNPLILISELLNYLDVKNYYGLETALYFNNKIWQPPLIYYLLNTKYNQTRTINKIKIKFVKIPLTIYSEETLNIKELKFSNYEKTILDLIFLKNKKLHVPENYDKINFYLTLYKKYPQVRATLIENLSFENRRLIK